MSYDIIGDIHGCSETLESLLDELGYARDADGVYRHPERRLIFLGDFVDRGPYQRETISIVRAMIDAGAAQAVMGNHEYNTIAYATPDEKAGGFLRAKLGQAINVRHVPELRFEHDDSAAEGQRISDLIDRAIGSDRAG